MDAPTIVNIEDFKKEIAESLNKYIDKVPAVVISSFFEKLSDQFSELARQQYKEAIKVLTESEVKEHGGQEGNRANRE